MKKGTTYFLALKSAGLRQGRYLKIFCRANFSLRGPYLRGKQLPTITNHCIKFLSGFNEQWKRESQFPCTLLGKLRPFYLKWKLGRKNQGSSMALFL